jgi:hypothetical protein
MKTINIRKDLIKTIIVETEHKYPYKLILLGEFDRPVKTIGEYDTEKLALVCQKTYHEAYRAGYQLQKEI